MISIRLTEHDHAQQPLPLAGQWAELLELLARSERLLRDELAERTGPRGISEAQFSLLWACKHAPPAGLSQNELAQSLTLSAAHISGQVEQLRAKGLLAGCRRPPDRRRQVWQLTDQGNLQLESLLSDLVQWFEQLESSLSTQRRADLSELLRKLAESLTGPAIRLATTTISTTAASDTSVRRGASA